MKEIRFKKADIIRVIAELSAYLDSLDEDKEYVILIKEHKQKRSLNANAYFWKLCGDLSAVTRVPMKEIYRSYIKEIGGNFDIICIQDKALDHFRRIWEEGHIGRFTEIADSKLQGCTNVVVYYGSSDYDTACMSRLIDMLVEDCKEQGIPTYNQEELEKLYQEWGEPNG